MFSPVAFRLELVAECASTQELLLARRGQPDFHGAALLARRQTAGYGRRGREWHSAEGNLALSFGLALENELALPLLPFACGVALHASCREFLPEGAKLRLKWPNDLYLDGKKLAGLIAQGRSVPGFGSEVVVGVGMNLKSAPAGLDPAAIAFPGEPPAPEELARVILDHLEALFLETVDFHQLREAWERAAALEETELTVVGENLKVKPEALLSTGELLVRDETGASRRLASEEVSVRFL